MFRFLPTFIASIPAPTLFFLYCSYLRANLWIDEKSDWNETFYEMLGHETSTLICTIIATFVSLIFVRFAFSAMRKSRLAILYLVPLVLLGWISLISVEGSLNFTLCYGGPKQFCTEDQFIFMRHAASWIAPLWAFGTIILEIALRVLFRADEVKP